MTRRYPNVAELQATLERRGIHVSVAELELRCVETTRGYERVYLADLGRYIALVDAERRALGLPVVPIGASLRLQAVEADLDGADEQKAVEEQPPEPLLEPRLRKPEPSAEELEREHDDYVKRERLAAPVDRKAQHAEVIRLRREGRSLVDAAALAGVTVKVARKWSSAARVRTVNRRNAKLTDQQIRELLGLVRAKTPRALIAQRYGIAVCTVTAVAARHARKTAAQQVVNV